MIYYTEDDTGIRELVLYTLKNTGFEAEGFCDSRELFDAIKRRLPQLILLDIMLPGESGVDILKKLRSDSSTRKIPVIMVTAKTSEYDKVNGFDCGADDYISKPFGMMEMVARIKAVLRRSGENEETETLEAGNIVLDVKRHTVTASGKSIDLTFKEFELLTQLLRNKGIVLTRDVLLERIWESAGNIETRTVDVHVRTLRAKLGSDGDIIGTVRGVGYKLC